MPITTVPKRSFDVKFDGPRAAKGPADPLVRRQQLVDQKTSRAKAMTSTLVNVDGEYATGFSPPDASGDIGRDYFIQAINGTQVMVVNKNTGATETTFLLQNLACISRR